MALSNSHDGRFSSLILGSGSILSAFVARFAPPRLPRLPRLTRAYPDDELVPTALARRTVRLYLVKPSKYDDDGSLLLFHWGVIPSNTLIVLAGLAADYARRRPEIDLQTLVWDELVDGALSPERISLLVEYARRDRVEPLVALCGVQSNQYARARDLALQLRRLEIPVLIGGFHVSSHAPSREFLQSAGVTTIVGEAETTLTQVLDEVLERGRRSNESLPSPTAAATREPGREPARAATLEAVPVPAPERGRSYSVTSGIRAKTGLEDILVPRIETAPLPAVDPRYLRSFLNPSFSTLDTSRGCPFVCSYCSVKNVMGRTMRSRDPSSVINWIRDAHDRFGVQNLLIVDDDFYRSPCWEPILLGIAELRRGGRPIWFLMQVDLEASADAAPPPGIAETERNRRSRRFTELAAEAGCFQVFVGFESFSPANLQSAAKFQNQDAIDRRPHGVDGHDPSPTEPDVSSDAATARVKERYRRAIERWHEVGVAVHAGYIVGMPFDGPGCGIDAARDLAEIGVDLASFFAYTPLPGTEDHVQIERAGLIRDHDFNAYDSQHFVCDHPRLSRAALAREYDDAYRHFYSWRRLAWCLGTGHRVAGLSWAARQAMMSHQVYYAYSVRRGLHPMIGGVWRLRDPSARRQAITDAEATALYL